MNQGVHFHKLSYEIANLLEARGVPYDWFEHEPVRTSHEAASVRPEFVLEQGAKALILKLYPKQGDPYFAQCVIPAHLQLDASLLSQELNLKRLRFATQEESDLLTDGVEFGGIPPFGNLFAIPVYADEKIMDQETIIFNAGDRRVSIAMSSDNWAKIVCPVFCTITK